MQKRSTLALLLASLLLGALLRFAWPNDIEYKADERLMFEWSQTVGVKAPWPGLGMGSSAGFSNPGMSVWLFVALARVSGASTPPQLAEAVIFLNVAALFLLAALALWRIPAAEREGWQWAIAVACVNPVAIQLQRKIWAQSVLPFFCVLFLWAWLGRRHRLGAFAWGLLGACLGQIHMTGFPFAAALALFTAVAARRSARWGWWLAGSLLGLIPLWPWLQLMFRYLRAGAPGSVAPWGLVLEPLYWRFWLLEPLGHSLYHSLGAFSFAELLREPVLFGHDTYLTGLACGVSYGVGLLGFGWALIRLLRNGRESPAPDGDGTVLAQRSAAFGYGGLLMLSRTIVHRHYLLVAYPLQYVFFTRQALRFPWRPRALLAALWLAQLVISIAFLRYVHTHGGAPGGDYGVSWEHQQGRLFLPY